MSATLGITRQWECADVVVDPSRGTNLALSVFDMAVTGQLLARGIPFIHADNSFFEVNHHLHVNSCRSCDVLLLFSG